MARNKYWLKNYYTREGWTGKRVECKKHEATSGPFYMIMCDDERINTTGVSREMKRRIVKALNLLEQQENDDE